MQHLEKQVEEALRNRGTSGEQMLGFEFARARLDRENKIYEHIAERISQLNTERNAPAQVELIDPAVTPALPDEALPWKKLAMVIVGALVLPFGIAVLWERSVQRVDDVEAFRTSTSLNIVGEIAALPKSMSGGEDQSRRKLSLFEESIDSLRTGLRLTKSLRDMRVLAIVSAVSQEGKTSLASQLAISMARASREPVLLIDADIRAPDINDIFEISNDVGLADVLEGECKLSDVIHADYSPRLHLMPAGQLKMHPHELIGESGLKEILDELKQDYRYIIIDTPPVLSCSEALVFATHADASLVCARRGYSRVRQVREAYDRLVRRGQSRRCCHQRRASDALRVLLWTVPLPLQLLIPWTCSAKDSFFVQNSTSDHSMTAPKATTTENPKPQSSEARRTRLSMNWRLLVATVVILACVIGLASVRYFGQRGVAAKSYLDRAEELEQDGDWLSAANHLYEYLKLQPEDTEVWYRLADAYQNGAVSVSEKYRAVEIFYQALGHINDREKTAALNRGLANLLLQIGRFPEAQQKAEELAADDPVARRVSALSHYRQLSDGDAQGKVSVLASLEEVVKSSPGDIESVKALVDLCRERAEGLERSPQELTTLADQTMDELVSHSPEDAEAWLTRYNYRRRYGIPGYESDLQQALGCGDDNRQVMLAAGDAAMVAASSQDEPDRLKSLELARDYYLKAVDCDDAAVEGYLGLGRAYIGLDRSKEARSVWQKGIQKCGPRGFLLRLELTQLFLSENNLESAAAEVKLARSSIHEIEAYFRDRSRRDFNMILARIDLLEAKVALGEAKFDASQNLVRRVLSTIGPKPTSDPERRLLVDALATAGSGAFGQGQWSQAATNWENAAEISPAHELMLYAANAWNRVGNSEKAIACYQQAIQRGAPPETYAALVDVHLRNQLAKRPEQRNWRPFDSALEEALGHDPDNWRLKIVQASREQLTNQPDRLQRASKHLAEAEAMSPNDAEMWHSLAMIYQRLGQDDAADRAVEKYAELTGNPVDVHLLRCMLLSAAKKHAEAVTEAEKAVEIASGDQKDRALRYLVMANRAAGNNEDVVAGLLKIHEAAPNDQAALSMLADVDLGAGNFERLKQWEQKLRDIDSDGVQWRFHRARRLLAEQERLSEQQAAEVEQLLQAILQRQPDWAFAHVLRGELLYQRQQYDLAVAEYRRAINQGIQRISVYEHLLYSLYASRQFDEADEVLARLQAAIPNSNNLALLGAAVAVQNEQLPEAIRRAKENLEARPNDPMAHIWLGQLLALDDQDAQAAESIQRATQIAPNDARPWLALFLYQLPRDKEAARATLQTLAGQADLDPTQRARILGRSYARLGDMQQSEQLLREALQEDPEDLSTQLLFAEVLLLQGDTDGAEAAFRRVVAQDKANRLGNVRRRLAALLAAKGGEEAWTEVGSLIGSDALQDSEQLADRRLHAVLLTRRGGVGNRAQARVILEQLTADANEVTAGDRLLLASIYEAEGNLQGAEGQFQALVDTPSPDPLQLRAFIEFFLRHDQLDQASSMLWKLEKLTSDGGIGGRLLYLATQAKWQVAAGRSQDIKPLLDKYAAQIEPTLESQQEKIGLWAALGSIFDSVEMHEEAQAWYEKLVAAAPQYHPLLARTLGKLGRHQQAVDLCIENLPDSKPTVGFLTTLVSILSSGEPSAQVFETIEPYVATMLETHRTDPNVVSNIAAIRVMQQREDDAALLLEEVLEKNPDDVLTLNNLATILGERPGRQAAARDYIDRAIAISGENPLLLDTKAVIHLEVGNPREAAKVLQQVAAMPRPDPRALFHLAIAYDQTGDGTRAKEALSRAVSLGLDSQILTSKDRQQRERLRDKLGQ